jgi:hypothetical protein
MEGSCCECRSVQIVVIAHDADDSELQLLFEEEEGEEGEAAEEDGEQGFVVVGHLFCLLV